MKHTLSVLVENEFGVLARVAGLFSGRGYNIESLTVAATLDPTLSRITLVTSGDDRVVEQIEKQLNKLIGVVRVTDFSGTRYVEREMVLIKVVADAATRSEVMNVVSIFRGKIIDAGQASFVIEITGDEGKIQAILELLTPLGVLEVVRTGKAAMHRGTRVFSAAEKEEKAA